MKIYNEKSKLFCHCEDIIKYSYLVLGILGSYKAIYIHYSICNLSLTEFLNCTCLSAFKTQIAIFLFVQVWSCTSVLFFFDCNVWSLISTYFNFTAQFFVTKETASKMVSLCLHKMVRNFSGFRKIMSNSPTVEKY